jgi:hypothetical protein
MPEAIAAQIRNPQDRIEILQPSIDQAVLADHDGQGSPMRWAGPTQGEPLEVVVAGGLVDILHAGVAIATHTQRFRQDQADRAPRARVARRARDATAGLTVTRLANGTGVVSFAGTDYQAGRAWARQSIDVSIVAGSVQLSRDGGNMLALAPPDGDG